MMTKQSLGRVSLITMLSLGVLAVPARGALRRGDHSRHSAVAASEMKVQS